MCYRLWCSSAETKGGKGIRRWSDWHISWLLRWTRDSGTVGRAQKISQDQEVVEGDLRTHQRYLDAHVGGSSHPSRPGRGLAGMVITGSCHWDLVWVLHSLKLWVFSAWGCGRRDTELTELVLQ